MFTFNKRTGSVEGENRPAAARSRNPRRGRPPRDGFTIMEMLVVISIITLLLAMASPSLSRAKESANNAKCLSNLGQIGVAITAYTDDSTGYLPPYKTPFEDFPKAYWGGLLAKGRYIDPGEPFSCPSYNPPRTPHLQATRTEPAGHWFHTQYGMNWQFIGSRMGELGANSKGLGTPPAPTPTPRVTQVRRPSDTIYVTDSWGKIWAGTANEAGIAFVGPSDAASIQGQPHVRHMGNTGVNVLWGDTRATHVKCSIPFNPHTPDALTDATLAPNNNFWDLK